MTDNERELLLAVAQGLTLMKQHDPVRIMSAIDAVLDEQWNIAAAARQAGTTEEELPERGDGPGEES